MKKWVMLEIVDIKNIFKNYDIADLFEGFMPIILCSPHSVWFIKYVFSAEIWVLKITTRITKYKSQVVKLNTDMYDTHV